MRSPIFSGAIIALLLVPALSMAWTGPTAAPPNGNVSAPINAGSIGQTKAGDLGILGKVGVGTYTPGTQLDVVGGYIRVQNTWGSNDYIAINGNQVWNTAGGNALYLQWSNPGGSVTVGGQAGATNNLSVQGAITARDSVTSPQYCIGTSCITSWASAVSIAAPTETVLTSGSGTYTVPANVAFLRVRMAGGGGGGGGASSDGGTGGTGGTTSFSAWTAVGGSGGTPNNNSVGGAGGTGGSGIATLRIPGGRGGAPGNGSYGTPGAGGNTPYFGGGAGNVSNNLYINGNPGTTNTGGGGGGGGIQNLYVNGGAGGGSGEYVEALIRSPAASYTYAVGAGGAAGTGASGGAGGAGGSGIIVIEEYYAPVGGSGGGTGGGTGGTGTGSNNAIPRFITTTTFGNSSLSSDGTSATANGNFTVTGQLCLGGACSSTWGYRGTTYSFTIGYTGTYTCPAPDVMVGLSVSSNQTGNLCSGGCISSYQTWVTVYCRTYN